MKAALYLRVSTLEQASEGISIAHQESKLRAFCESQDWIVEDVYIDDGYSAKNINRPQIQRLLTDVEKKKFDVVVVYKLDRLIRNVINLNEILQELDANDVKFKSSTEAFDTTTAAGRLFLNIVAAMAQWERETTVERVRDVMLKKAIDGEWSGGSTPFGYRLENKQLYIEDTEAGIVREIFDLARIWGDRRIADEMNRKGHKLRGNPFMRHNIAYIVNNPIYIGKQRYNDGARQYSKSYDQQRVFDAKHEAIVNDEIFNLVQKRRQSHRDLQTRNRESEYLYSSLLRCQRCGQSIYGYMNRKDYRYYRCEGVAKKECDLPIINEAYVTDSLLNNYQKLIPELEQVQGHVTSGEIVDHSKRIEELDRLQKKYKELFVRDYITIEEMEKEMSTIQKERQTLTAPIEQDEQIDKVAFYDFMESWHDMNTEEKQTFLKIMFKFIRINAHGKKGEPKTVDIIRVG